jgi:hypothetical protein
MSFEMVQGGFEYGEHNQEGEKILNFVVAYDLMVEKSSLERKNLI